MTPADARLRTDDPKSPHFEAREADPTRRVDVCRCGQEHR